MLGKISLMLEKIEGKRRSRQQRNEIGRWHHQLNGYEFEQTPGGGEGEGSLVQSMGSQ